MQAHRHVTNTGSAGRSPVAPDWARLPARLFACNALAAALLGLALLLAGVGAGQDADRGLAQFTEDEERVQLFNSCRPMFFVVDGINDEVEGIGLTKEVLLPAIESRLRAARLYPDAPKDVGEAVSALLVANVNVVRSAFHVSVAYAKRVTDEFGPTPSQTPGVAV